MRSSARRIEALTSMMDSDDIGILALGQTWLTEKSSACHLCVSTFPDLLTGFKIFPQAEKVLSLVIPGTSKRFVVVVLFDQG